MGERTSYSPGTFSWTDLSTPDQEGAKTFYSGLFGWETEDNDIGDGGVYTMCRVDGKTVAAISGQRAQEREQGVPPTWNSYATVADADATAARVKELGGGVMVGPFDVFTAGRMAFVQDPQGAVFAVWQAQDTVGAELVNTPGSLTLNQLNTSDPDAAGRFYGELFGWSVERQTDEDAGQPYWGLFNDGVLNGGMMQLPDNPAAGPPHWLVYFGSDDLDATTRQIRELGGQVVVPPMVIPGGRFAVAQDPQGAFFAMFEGRFDD